MLATLQLYSGTHKLPNIDIIILKSNPGNYGIEGISM